MTEVSINKQARLSEHFTLAEMCKTSAKTPDGNIPSHVHIENLRRLCSWGTVAMARAMTPSSSTVAIEVRQLTRP